MIAFIAWLPTSLDSASIKETADSVQAIKEIRTAVSSRSGELLDMWKNFLQTCTYSIVLEWWKPLRPWDCGKIVLVFSVEKRNFSVIFGEWKTTNYPKDTLKVEEFFLTNTQFDKDVGFHIDISVPDGFVRIWWACYLVRSSTDILVSWKSSTLWNIHREIVQKCFSNTNHHLWTVGKNFEADETSFIERLLKASEWELFHLEHPEMFRKD